MRSNHDEDSNADDRTVGSSNSLGSLTTVENFETEEDLIASSAGKKIEIKFWIVEYITNNIFLWYYISNTDKFIVIETHLFCGANMSQSWNLYPINQGDAIVKCVNY